MTMGFYKYQNRINPFYCKIPGSPKSYEGVILISSIVNARTSSEVRIDACCIELGPISIKSFLPSNVLLIRDLLTIFEPPNNEEF